MVVCSRSGTIYACEQALCFENRIKSLPETLAVVGPSQTDFGEEYLPETNDIGFNRPRRGG